VVIIENSIKNQSIRDIIKTSVLKLLKIIIKIDRLDIDITNIKRAQNNNIISLYNIRKT